MKGEEIYIGDRYEIDPNAFQDARFYTGGITQFCDTGSGGRCVHTIVDTRKDPFNAPLLRIRYFREQILQINDTPINCKKCIRQTRIAIGENI